MSAAAKDFLFVCGCPRSGTTGLALWLNHHPEICIGTERYGKLSMGRKMTPDLFEPERFSEIRETDCAYADFRDFMRAVGLPDRIKTARIVGDKQPLMFMVFDHINAVFPGAKFIYIGRNIFDVAASYKRRLLRSADKWNFTIATAVQHWNEGISKTLAYRSTGRPLLVLEYERLYAEGQGLDEIGAFLGIDPKPLHDAKPSVFSAGIGKAERRARAPALTLEERLYINQSADWTGYKELIAR